MALTKTEARIAAKLKRWQKAKARAKALYDRSDLLMKELAALLKPGEPVRISEKTEGKNHVVLLDNYAGKDVVWGHGGVRRWDFETLEILPKN